MLTILKIYVKINITEHNNVMLNITNTFKLNDFIIN